MYDKVKLWLPKSSTTPDISQFLDNAKEQTNLTTGEVCTFGGLNGLKVTANMGYLSIIGSLSKLLYPNNIYPLDRHTTSQAIEKLSDILHLDMSLAKVIGLEFGCCFAMKHPINMYLHRLGEMPKLSKGYFNDHSLYYQSKGNPPAKVFVFYDKKAEAKEKKMEIPTGLRDANLLKYEMRLNGKLSRQLKVPEVTASTLSEMDFYRLLVKRYQDGYFAITKLKQVKTNVMSKIRTVSDARDVFFARLINQGGETQIADFLEELKLEKVFNDRKSYTRLKDRLLEVATKASITTSDELTKELDDAIKNVGAYV